MVTGVVVRTVGADETDEFGLPAGLMISIPDVDAVIAAVAESPARRGYARPTLEIVRPELEGLVDRCRTEAEQPRTRLGRGSESPDAPIVCAGLLSELDLATVLSMIERANKSGRLLLEATGRSATIDFLDGEIVDVSLDGAATRQQALHALLRWTDGTFELRSLTPPRHSSPINVRWLLLDHARIEDERSRTARK